MEKVYIQTATFSNTGLLENDFDNTMRKIAEAGYSGIELFAGLHGNHSAKELGALLGSLGLEIIGSHVYESSTDEQLEYLSGTDCKNIICPGLHVGSRDEAYAAAEKLNSLGEKSKKYGMKYGYHNHNSDFNVYDGETVIDILIRNTDPELVFFELDAGWAWRAGRNAADFINLYAGRFELIHVKETSRLLTPEDDFGRLFKKYDIKFEKNVRPVFPPEMLAEMAEIQKMNCKLGEGITRVPEYVAAGDAQGTKAYIVEREYAYTGNMFTAIKEDCDYLKKI